MSAARSGSNPRNAISRSSPVLRHRRRARPFPVYAIQSVRSRYGERPMARVGSQPSIAFSILFTHDPRGSMRPGGRASQGARSFVMMEN